MPTTWRRADAGFEIVFDVRGATLEEVAAGPRPAGEAAAVQLLGAAAFLLERGWFPSRRLLGGARCERGPDGPILTLPGLPTLRLDDPTLARRLRTRPQVSERLLATILWPLLDLLLPERSDAIWTEIERPATAAPGGTLLAAVRGAATARGVRRLPAAAGRGLWARRLAIPGHGAWWLDEAAAAARVAAAASLSAALEGRALEIAVGEFDEAEISRRLARAAAAGVDGLVLSTLPTPLAQPLPLAGGEEPVWLLGLPGAPVHAHLAQAIELGAARPLHAREVLEAGAESSFTAAPAEPPGIAARERLASVDARRALASLRAAPAGLTVDDLRALGDVGATVLDELARLRLALCRHGVWHALGDAAAGDAVAGRELAERLPVDSPRGMLARARIGGDAAPLATWCESRLDAGAALEVFELTGGAAGIAAVGAHAAEAALALGRLAAARAALDGLPASEPRRHALVAWWADQAGAPEELKAEL
ncbi:MAG: hypothetical protein H6Q02_754, partial [Acidobacteria bacterium]|nr:hypothetical protein [Acidobacteriota bacterium]